ncbi:formylmethionine deformylase-like protein [Colletotrichum tabaci]|uniref:Formylmethionine deformylase-like protein n=1 Tax=Colletotrichum tabaci TaxID=1209068 RepID=A0AAV9TQ29_9PEZI
MLVHPQRRTSASSVSLSSSHAPVSAETTPMVSSSSSSPPPRGWHARSTSSIFRKPVPATALPASKKSGPTVHVTETTERTANGQMDAHGIDLSSLGGSSITAAARYGGADPVFRGRDSISPDEGAAAGDDAIHGHHVDQRHDARAGLLQNAQESAYDGYSSSSPGSQQQYHQQQQYRHYHEQLHDHQQPAQPPPYISKPLPGSPNEPGKKPFGIKHPGCGWHASWNMYLWLVLGVACAVGHHVFYHTLDGRAADDQVRMLRYGTVLAFGAKASLGAAVISAFQQRIWTTVRSRFMTIAALDSLFAATENFVALFNWEFLKGAKAAAALALFVWLSPLVVILTSNTLLVEPRTIMENTTCPSVRSLNFAKEDTHQWREPVKIDGRYEMPLSIWNSTKPADSEPDGWFDYYTGPSPNFQQTATLGAFLQEVVTRKNASTEVCGKGWNCTFEIDFTAPGYRCSEQARGIGSRPANLTQASGEAPPPFGTDILLPEGTYAYYAFTSGGEYSTTQMKEVEIGGIPKMDPPYPEHMGALRTEPVIWIGHVVPPDAEHPASPTASPREGDEQQQHMDYVPKIFACEHLETEYTAVFNYTDATQSAYMKTRRFLGPIINTTFVPGLDADDGTADNVTAVPEENYVLPRDVERYRRVAAYHSLGFMLRRFLNGTVQVDRQSANPMANTEAIQTKLLDPRNSYFPVFDLQDVVQEFYEDLILSIFSTPQFLPVVWAARPDENSGGLAVGGGGGGGGNRSAYEYPCQRSRVANMYSYHARDLWIVYAIAILLSSSGVALGALAVRENGGVLRNTRFSSVVAATRGPALDKVHWEGPDRDRGDVPADVKRLKLGYGVMNQGIEGSSSGGGGGLGIGDERYPRQSMIWSPSEIRCGFGLEGDVNQKRKEGSLFHR